MDETIKIKFIGDTTELEKSSNKASQSVNRVSQSIETLRAKMEARKQFLINETDISKIAVYNREIASLKRQIDKIQTIGIGDSGLGQLSKGANTAFSSIRKLAYILPGIGVAGLIGQFSDLAIQMVQGGITVDSIGAKLGILSKKVLDTQAVMSGFGEIFKEAAKKSGEDIIKLEVFRQKLNDVNIPAAERLKILKEYNSTADKTNQIDAAQIGNLQLINEKLEAQNTLILKRALSTAAMSKISEAANKLIEGELKLQEELSKRGFNDLDDFIQKQKAANAERAKSFVQNPNAFKDAQNLNAVRQGLDGIVAPAAKAALQIKNDDSALQGLISTVTKGRSDLQKFIGSISGLLTVEGVTTQTAQDKTTKEQKTEFLFDFLPFDPSGKLKPEQKGQLLSAIDKFSKEFTGVLKGVNFNALADSQDEKIKLALKFDADLKAGKVQFDVKAFTDAINKGLKSDELMPKDTLEGLASTVVDQFIRAMSGAGKVDLGNLIQFDTPEKALADVRKQLSDFGRSLPQTFEATNIFGEKVTVTLADLLDFSKISPEEAVRVLRGIIPGFKTAIKDFNDQVKAVVESTQENLVINVGEGLANAISGEGLEGAFKSIAGIMGDFTQELGKLLIRQAIVVETVQKALATILKNPAAKIAVGIGLVILGQVIKNSVLPKPRGFAKGGWVPGSGNGDTVPAMLTPGEYVVPKHKASLAAKLFGDGFPRMLNGVMGYANGGVVTANQVDRTNGVAAPISFPQYLPAFSMTHDQFRMWYRRAETYGNTFGR